jgi:hypothetical protein
MIKQQLLLSSLLTLNLSALETQTVHSSASLYYEMKDFTNSKQKLDGSVIGVGADVHYKASEFRAAYEYGFTNTIQPPLTQDLKTDKLFLRYAYNISDTFTFNLNYINILNDNIAETDKGVAYGAGLTYNINQALSTNFTQFYTDYEKFDVYQSELRADYKSKIEQVGFKLSAIGKYIEIKDRQAGTFSAKADDIYKTVGFKFHSHYQTYHFGFGAFFGKRAFAIMDEGFKIQHHAMEFDKTYAVGVGKTFSDIIVRYQYIYQRAAEVPLSNENVQINNHRIVLNYKF